MNTEIKDNKHWKLSPDGTYFTWNNLWKDNKVKNDPWFRPLPKKLKATYSKGAPWQASSLDGWDTSTVIDGEKVKLSIGVMNW